MALAVKQQSVKQVPWFSLNEWHQVYRQIYSNDTAEQSKAYEMLLVWRARISKLPVGIDCTISILQVCLRDREWTPKINQGELPISYENDLCLMYSTTIMRFLNHISAIGRTKQPSLFQIAKQLKIPEWIVLLRHDTAHGQELPSIGVLRIAVNMLLTWLHEEYWTAQAKKLEKCFTCDETANETQESEEFQEFSDLIEFWTAVSLYIHAGYHLVMDVPDPQLVETLQDLRLYVISLSEENSEDVEDDKDNYVEVSNDIKEDKEYKLETAKTILLSEISRYLNRKSMPNKKEIVCEVLFNSEAFLPNKDILLTFTQKKSSETQLKGDLLPLDMLEFWKDIVLLLYEKGLMEDLILELHKLVSNEDADKHKRLLASLWISSIVYSFLKLDVAYSIARTLEYQLEEKQKKLLPTVFEYKVKEQTNRTCPRLKNTLWFNLSDVVLPCLTDINFFSRLVLNANEYSVKFILPILKLISPKIDKESKQLLLNLLYTYTKGKSTEAKNSDDHQETFTLEDIHNQYDEQINVDNERSKCKDETSYSLTDRNVRNLNWKLSHADYDWSSSPIGILPWQIDSLEMLNPAKTVSLKFSVPALVSEITPGVIDNNDLKMESQINWDTVLRTRKRVKRKLERKNADIMINRALETAKKQK